MQNSILSMEFFLLKDWRKQGITLSVVKDICNKLKELGCPKVYLTATSQSKAFWKKSGFSTSGLIDPDNKLPILLKDL